MAANGDTGNTATIVFGTTSFVGNYKRIGGTKQTRKALDDTVLATTSRYSKCPDDLIDTEAFECELLWNPSYSVYPPIGSAPETVTITFPVKSGQSAGGTLAGTAFLTEATGPDLVNGELMSNTFMVQWDGKTGPTYTAGS